MKFKESHIRELIKEEIQNLTQEGSEELSSEEKGISAVAYILLGKAMEKIEEYLGELGEETPPSKNLEKLYDILSKAWRSVDEILTGGETKQALPNLFEDNGDCTQEEISNAMDVITRCVMSGKTERPSSTTTDLGVMPKRTSAPPAGTQIGKVKFVEDKENE